jgi:hypothetical protein
MLLMLNGWLIVSGNVRLITNMGARLADILQLYDLEQFSTRIDILRGEPFMNFSMRR